MNLRSGSLSQQNNQSVSGHPVVASGAAGAGAFPPVDNQLLSTLSSEPANSIVSSLHRLLIAD